MIRRWATLLALAMPLAGAVDEAGAQANRPGGPPHEWVFGSWTGGIFPIGEVDPAGCFAAPVVIFTRDLVMRVAAFDVAYHQRAIETAAALPDGALEFRFVPAAPVAGAPSAAGCRPISASAAAARQTCSACSGAARTRSPFPIAPTSPPL